MAKAVRLICVGMVPLILGFLLNGVMQTSPISGFIWLALSFLLLIAWGYLAFKVSNPAHNSMMQALLMCAFGLVMLLFVLYQELVMGAYWGNIIGVGTQMYFLPWVALASLVIHSLRLWPIYVAIWLGLFVTSCIGCLLKRHK